MSTRDTDPIEFAGLVKRFGRRTALDGLSFTVPAGSVVGLLGLTGAPANTPIRLREAIVAPSIARSSPRRVSGLRAADRSYPAAASARRLLRL